MLKIKVGQLVREYNMKKISKEWITSKFTTLTNVKTVAELEQ